MRRARCLLQCMSALCDDSARQSRERGHTEARELWAVAVLYVSASRAAVRARPFFEMVSESVHARARVHLHGHSRSPVDRSGSIRARRTALPLAFAAKSSRAAARRVRRERASREKPKHGSLRPGTLRWQR